MDETTRPRYVARQGPRLRVVELYIWLLAGVLLSGRFWLALFGYGPFIPGLHPETLQTYYLDILVGILSISFPVLYRLVFGLLPIEHLRLTRFAARGRLPREAEFARRLRTAQEEVPRPTGGLTKDTEPLAILAHVTQSSRDLSGRIFARAGIYLIVGVLIAFSGLVFFYTQNAGAELVPEGSDAGPLGIVGVQAASLAPRFGILFFIEVIAFFFLRQYRIAMEEFRYFEAIQRKREETFALLKLTLEQDESMSISELINSNAFFSTAGKLAAGETTELLESRKLTKDELDIMEKIVSLVARSR